VIPRGDAQAGGGDAAALIEAEKAIFFEGSRGALGEAHGVLGVGCEAAVVVGDD
jgi:hypothetical protein